MAVFANFSLSFSAVQGAYRRIQRKLGELDALAAQADGHREAIEHYRSHVEKDCSKIARQREATSG